MAKPNMRTIIVRSARDQTEAAYETVAGEIAKEVEDKGHEETVVIAERSKKGERWTHHEVEVHH